MASQEPHRAIGNGVNFPFPAMRRAVYGCLMTADAMAQLGVNYLPG
jgi:hypothetical protein